MFIIYVDYINLIYFKIETISELNLNLFKSALEASAVISAENTM